jgi:hypothetical protein
LSNAFQPPLDKYPSDRTRAGRSNILRIVLAPADKVYLVTGDSRGDINYVVVLFERCSDDILQMEMWEARVSVDRDRLSDR